MEQNTPLLHDFSSSVTIITCSVDAMNRPLHHTLDACILFPRIQSASVLVPFSPIVYVHYVTVLCFLWVSLLYIQNPDFYCCAFLYIMLLVFLAKVGKMQHTCKQQMYRSRFVHFLYLPFELHGNPGAWQPTSMVLLR